MKTITRETCRICESPLKDILSLGDFYVSTFVKPGEDGLKAPLNLSLCTNEDCELLQLKDTAPQESLYSGHYWYRSDINKVIVNDLEDIVSQALDLVEFEEHDRFLDIGANDGTLLSFVPDEWTKVGCEPAKNLLSDLMDKCDIMIGDFWSENEWRKRIGPNQAKVITAIGMFYDMEDPNQFIRDAANCLHDDGVFIAQLMTLAPMIKNNDLGNICHEHLEYYSYKSLKYLFEKNGLEIIHVEENDINGGSYRIFARRLQRDSIEYQEGEFTEQDIIDFGERLKKARKSTVSYIRRRRAIGKKIYGYGASTKGNTILQYYGLTNKDLVGIADKNPTKFGLETIGTHIPIVDEADAKKDADIFLILPWGFTDTFVKKNKDWMQKGGKFIVSTPEFKVYEK